MKKSIALGCFILASALSAMAQDSDEMSVSSRIIDMAVVPQGTNLELESMNSCSGFHARILSSDENYTSLVNEATDAFNAGSKVELRGESCSGDVLIVTSVSKVTMDRRKSL